MLDAKVSANSTIAERLKRLAALYQHGQTSPLMERTLHKLMTHEADVCRTHLKELRQDLAAFERQYGLNSDEFYRRFQAGQTDDRMDYVEWASLVQMTENLQARLQLLTKA
ncbi:MAG TPA: hypothetical protein PKZ84_02775 [Anaerolineae bacterium]|nr:hypothetical protein [Anaerolineae bacterium]HQI84815.1 hypothetical protein [Anaerolineae bacterium]